MRNHKQTKGCNGNWPRQDFRSSDADILAVVNIQSSVSISSQAFHLSPSHVSIFLGFGLKHMNTDKII